MLVYHKADIIISPNVTHSYHYIIAYHDFNYHFHLYSRYCWNLSWSYTFISVLALTVVSLVCLPLL
jgi:hypothetical protein